MEVARYETKLKPLESV